MKIKFFVSALLLIIMTPYMAEACRVTPFVGSQKMINSILEDLSNQFKGVGGPITEIKQLATFKWQVSISQEGKVDQIIYEFNFDDSCKSKIIKKTPSTKSMGPPRSR